MIVRHYWDSALCLKYLLLAHQHLGLNNMEGLSKEREATNLKEEEENILVPEERVTCEMNEDKEEITPLEEGKTCKMKNGEEDILWA